MASFYTRVSTTKSGKEKRSYRVEYRDLNGKKKTKQFKVRKKGLEFLKAIEDYIDMGKKGLPLTVSEASEQWLDDCKVGIDGNFSLERHTIQTYAGQMRNNIIPKIGDKFVPMLEPSDIRKLRDDLLLECTSRVTANAALTCFKSFMSYCVSKEITQNNPCNKITIKMSGRHVNSSVEIPSKEEIKTLCDKALELRKTDKGTWVRYCPMLFILTYCGVRISELIGLPRNAINLNDCTIDIFQRADRYGVIGPPKTKYGYRKLYYPEYLNEMIYDHLKTHNYELAFSSEAGTAMAQRNVHRRMWRSLLKRANMKNTFKMHSLRHFYASIMINKGADVKQLSINMGHHNVAFTLQTYGHLFNDDKENTIRKEMANSIVL